MIKQVRKYHKWLMAFIGLQFLFWSITGLYMVTMDIHFIHGEPLQEKPTANIQSTEISLSINELLNRYPQAENVSVISILNVPVYQFNVGQNSKNWFLVDAISGAELPLMSESLAIEIAEASYRYDHKVVNVQLLQDTAPSELASRHLPVWQVEFEHFTSPTFYVSQTTGQVVTKRHTYWRLFDWMWRFHIMDYDDGENVANIFLTIIAILGLVAALSGAVLTYVRVFRSEVGSGQ